MKYGRLVGTEEKHHNVPWSMVNYKKLNEYEESVEQRGCGYRQVDRADALDPWWDIFENFLSMGEKWGWWNVMVYFGDRGSLNEGKYASWTYEKGEKFLSMEEEYTRKRFWNT